MSHVLSFGEILWDLFPESKVIGGAPFNFAAHLAKLGADVSFVSAVGADELGDEAIACMESLGIKSDCTTRHPLYKTGYCKVTLQDGTPSYDLAWNVAYDHIPVPAALPEKVDALYCGTLACRASESLLNLLFLMSNVEAKEVFFDVNIRGNDWSPLLIMALLAQTTILKFSREEAPALASAFGLPTDGDVCTELCKMICENYPDLKQILVTLDKDGAFVFDTKTGQRTYAPKPQNKVVSTVGAGDSFSACYVYNYLEGCDIATCLARASALSDYVVTQLGAVPEYTDELIKKIK
ncbi:MAG: carbohydrate kinase [Clostridia bacterium]|nr:carbohydrate kinase [Clostridia bacterium]